MAQPFRYLFGPVPSRRLGMSLGVDLVPKKVCSLDCVYCEVGPTTKLTNRRMEYIPYSKIVEDLKQYFNNNPDPDYITFSGYGEPTLNSRLGDIIRFIRENKPHIPVAVLTNGTLFYDKKVRDEVRNANLLLPSLDAATAKGFQKLNRPAKDLHIEKVIRGLMNLRKEFSGEIWLEVFIVPGYNDNPAELDALKEAFIRIKPGKIQLNTLDRPGTEAGIRAASNQELKKIRDHWGLDNVEVIAAAPERKKIRSYRQDAENTILGTIARRPCTVDDLSRILGLHVNEVNKYLDVLEHEGKIQSKREERGVFYFVTGNSPLLPRSGSGR